MRRAISRKTECFLTGKYYRERVVAEFNDALLRALMELRPKVAWLEWPVLVRRETLAEATRRLPGCRFVSFQDDNPFGSRSGEQKRWRCFLDAIPEYDLHFVKRETDVCEFRRLGAKEVMRFMHGFYPPLFRPLPAGSIPPAFLQNVSFVGSPLDHRVAVISDLLGRHKLPVRVYGNRWNRTLAYYLHRECFRSEVLAEDYVKVICGSEICLGFVSSSNRDDYSMRTFEVPACKGFFLAERTATHQELFEEGIEAEFFSSTEECAEKIRFYLKHDTARTRIAEQGHRRCIGSDYSLRKRLADAVEEIESIRN